MRIRPDQPIDLPLREGTRPTSRTTGFDTALSAAQATSGKAYAAASAEGASGGGAYERLIVANRGQEAGVPLAQRWGQYGAGATAAGYGEPPDPSEYSDHPVGENEPAHPLNPVGITTTDAPFTVTGYTGRGTPVPPGFYNLAYYQWYLREGGTPLEGFPGYDPADGTLQEVYGSFGDGRTRATSFTIDGNGTPGVRRCGHRVSGGDADTAPSAAADLATAADAGVGDVASGGDAALSAEAESGPPAVASAPAPSAATPAASGTSRVRGDTSAVAQAGATSVASPANGTTAPAPETDDLQTLTDRLLASMGDDPTARARLATNLTALLDALVRS